jgi:hypothetical protein
MLFRGTLNRRSTGDRTVGGGGFGSCLGPGKKQLAIFNRVTEFQGLKP